MNTQILVDGSNAWYRCYTATPLEQPGGAVMIMTRMLRKICHKYGRSNVVVCWDAGDGGRKEIDSNYKAERKAVAGVWEDLPYMKRMAACVGISTAEKQGYEADDIAGSLATQTQSPVLIQSYDKDFYQLVDGRIRIYRPARKVAGKEVPELYVDTPEVVEEFGCSPNKVVLLKSFHGDASDNISKLPVRFTKNFKEQFLKVIAVTDNVDQFYSRLNLIDEKYHSAFIKFKEQALTNEKIIKIKTDLNIEITPNEINSDLFDSLCDEIKITALKIEDWISLPEEPAPPPPVQRGLF